MSLIVIQALFFFLPAYFSNAVPLILNKFKVFEFLNIRVDGGIMMGGYPLFGTTKTYRGIIGGTIGGMLIVLVQALIYLFFQESRFLFILPYDLPNILILGFLLGIGEGLGDLIKSFFKRRLRIDSTAPSIPLDQSSFLGAMFLSFFYVVIPNEHIATILIISPIIPLIANVIAYKIGWKKVWW